MRRLITIMILVAIMAAAFWTLLGWGERTVSAADPWKAVPPNAAVVLEITDPLENWNRITHTSQFWNELHALPAAEAVDSLIQRAASAMQPSGRDLISRSMLLTALVPVGGEDFGVLLIWPDLPDLGMDAVAANLGIAPQQARELHEGRSVAWRPDTALPALSMALREHLVLLATHENVLEDALLACAQGGLSADSLATRARRALGAGTDAHILAHLPRTADLLAAWSRPQAMEDLHWPPAWVAMDLRVRADALLASGVVIQEGTDHPLVGEVGNEERSGSMRVLPPEVSCLRILRMPSLAVADTTARAWLPGGGGLITLANAATSAGDSITAWAVIAAGDPQEAWSRLASVCPQPNGCDTAAYRGKHLVHGQAIALNAVFGPAFASFEAPWYTVLGEQVVFASDLRALQRSIDAWLDGSSLATDLRAADQFQRYTTTAAGTLWCDLARAFPMLRSLANEATSATMSARADIWSSLGAFVVQWSPGASHEDLLTLCLQHAPLARHDVNTLWTATLPAPFQRAPEILRNHHNGTREVLVQDRAHDLSLMSCTGRVLWTRAFSAPIIGAVHQVDRFRNGKLQMLFNTAEQVYMVDRNGKDVEGFPIALKERCAGPIAVFDYDQKRDYRIVLTTVEGHVLNYAIDGHALGGWDAQTLSQTSREPVRHLRIRTKDYLLIVQDDGLLRILDRRGVKRYEPRLTLPGLNTVLEVRPGLEIGSSTLVWSDTSGALRSGTIDGVMKEIAAPGTAHGMAIALDIDDDGVMEQVIANGRDLRVIRNSEPLFRRAFATDITVPPALLVLPSQPRSIGVVEGGAGLLHFMDDTGRDLPNLAFRGSAPFAAADLDLDGRYELITGDGTGQVVVYSLATPGQPD